MMDYVITAAEAEQNGLSLDTVAVCRQIRNLARLDRLALDESEHRSGLNKHLFSYIEYCGMDVRGYIREYLSNLQPFMIERLQSQELIALLDERYKVKSQKGIDVILERIKDSIHANAFASVMQSFLAQEK